VSPGTIGGSPTSEEMEELREQVRALQAMNAAAVADMQFLAAMERVGRCMGAATDLTELLEAVLDELLDIFGCDRAWLLYPCDPAAPSWGVPMERTVAAWPGVFAFGVEVPMDPGAAGVMEEALSTPGCLPYDSTTERSVPEEVGQAFGVRSQLSIAIRPHSDNAWLLGLHHCSDDHVYTEQEQRIFEGLGARIADALDAMVLLRDLRETEQQVTQLQRMQAIGSLAGGVAHDFNNQLLVILCYADLLRDGMTGGTEFVDHVIEAAERASGLTKQLLAFSRRSVLEPRPVDLAGLVADSIDFLARAVGTSVTMNHARSPGALIATVDPHQLQQVLVNLVMNARDAMPKGGAIEISTGSADSALPPELSAGDYLCLSVRDDGSGMDETTRSRVFEPFFTTKDHGEGTGLGLSTAYGVARQSGGTLTVQSTLGEGSVFTLWLPATDDAATQTSGDHAPVRAVGGSERVLVLDEAPDVAEVASRVLRSHGYEVVTATSANEALSVLQRSDRPFDLLLTDVVMRGMDGVELAASALRAQPSLRVTFSTGYSPHAIERLRDAGATRRVLQKPYLPAALLAHVRTVLDA